DFSFNFSGTCTNFAFSMYDAELDHTNEFDSISTETGSSSSSVSLDVDGGFVIAISRTYSSTANRTVTWTGVNEDHEFSLSIPDSQRNHSVASLNNYAMGSLDIT